MSQMPPSASADLETPSRPRIAIMGEFSAGKSTLTNLLLGEQALPVKVTATQLPPVWISHGSDAPVQVAMDGTESPVDLADPAGVSVFDVQYVRVFHMAGLLESCELIDMPGISDPNMPADMWERVANEVDGVVWCTHAGQAWRQSEDAVWGTMPPELYDRSLLLITRFDKIVEERDRKRLIARVTRETEDLFRAVYPISLTEALDAGEDEALWAASGADAFARALFALIERLGGQNIVGAAQAGGAAMADRPSATTERPAPVAAPATAAAGAPAASGALPRDTAASVGEGRVAPQRIRRAAAISPRQPRPPRQDTDAPQV